MKAHRSRFMLPAGYRNSFGTFGFIPKMDVNAGNKIS
jgi:hypothetical protein